MSKTADQSADHKKLEITARSLENNMFSVFMVENKEAAVEKILGLIGKSDIVGVGGSQTLVQIGILGKLAEQGNIVLGAAPAKSLEESLAQRRKALTADIYMASPNAITTDGRLMFLDSIGNRTAGMMFGPQKVIAVAGINKIVDSIDAGWDRINNIASPLNAKRLKLSTPCTATAVCSDCSSEQRICNIEVVLRRKPKYTNYNVILINDNFGF